MTHFLVRYYVQFRVTFSTIFLKYFNFLVMYLVNYTNISLFFGFNQFIFLAETTFFYINKLKPTLLRELLTIFDLEPSESFKLFFVKYCSFLSSRSDSILSLYIKNIYIFN